ncbi:MAG TPA: diaminopimelate decarboxylase, partial [Cyanobacteria bacterium UBA8530]|nr:diaminopimelate decarboxylase [Cyanobacteria bacterium UBA8530]
MKKEFWWQRKDLGYREGSLCLGSTDLSSLACSANSPFFAYHPPRVGEKIEGLRKALQSLPLPSRLFYALKSNRFAPLLTKMQALGPLGIDACSPRELLLARQIGFAEKEISFTSTSVSDADLAVINRHPGVWLNCDSLSSIRRVGKSFPKRTIGLRINPGLGIGYSSHERLRYAGEKATKFGIYREDFEEALSLAKKSGLRVGGLHVHAGCGYLNPQLPLWNELLAIVKSFVDQVPDLEVLNLGGGLGIPLVQGDEALDLASWSASIARHFGGKGFEIWVEPGDYLVKDAGVLVLQVTSVERKSGTLFVGVDGGFNL